MPRPGTKLVDQVPNEDALRRMVKDKALAVVGWVRREEKCDHCRKIVPIFEELAKRYQRTVYFAQIDVDENRPVAVRHGIDVVPTFFFFRKGVKLSGDTLAGGDADVLRHKLKKLARAHGQKYFPGQGHQVGNAPMSPRRKENPWANPNWTPPGMRGNTVASVGKKNRRMRPGKIKIPGSGALSRIFNLPTPGKTPKAKPGLFTKLTPRAKKMGDEALLAMTDDGCTQGFGSKQGFCSFDSKPGFTSFDSKALGFNIDSKEGFNTDSNPPGGSLTTTPSDVATPSTPIPSTPLSPADGRQKPTGHRNKLPPRPRDLHKAPAINASDSDDEDTVPSPSRSISSDSSASFSSRATGTLSPRRGVVIPVREPVTIAHAPTPILTVTPTSSTEVTATQKGTISFVEVQTEQLTGYKPKSPGASDMGGSNYCWGLDADFRAFIKSRHKNSRYDICYYSKVSNVAETINELYGYDWNVRHNAGSCHSYQGFCFIVRYSSDAPPRKNIDPQAFMAPPLNSSPPPLESELGQLIDVSRKGSKNRKRLRQDETLDSNKRQRRRHEPPSPPREPSPPLALYEGASVASDFSPPALPGEVSAEVTQPHVVAPTYTPARRSPRGVVRHHVKRGSDWSIGMDGFQDDLPELSQPIGARIMSRLFKTDADTTNTSWLRDLMKLGLTRGQARNALLITNNTSFEAARDLLLGAPKAKQDTTKSQYADYGSSKTNDVWVQERKPLDLRPQITEKHINALKRDEAQIGSKHQAMQSQIQMLRNRLEKAEAKNGRMRAKAVSLMQPTTPPLRSASAL